MSDGVVNKKTLLDLADSLVGHTGNDDKNLFEMVSVKEFRHSAILGYILNRREHGSLIHLKSLLKRAFDVNALCEKGDVHCEYMVECPRKNKRPIDVFCTFDDDKALIIENKCCGAGDQGKQIVDYWNGVKCKLSRLPDAEKRIYVLYLPPMNDFDGPSNDSLGELGGRFSPDGGDLSGHFVSQSYRQLILPWLREDVLPRVSYGNGMFVRTLIAYIDMLEGMFGARAKDEDGRARLLKVVEAKFANEDIWEKVATLLKKIEDVFQKAGILESEQNRLEELRNALASIQGFLFEQDPFLDVERLRNELKWMLRNNATTFGKTAMRDFLNCGDVFRNSAKVFKYGKCLYVGLERNVITPSGKKTLARVHVNCNGLVDPQKIDFPWIIYGGLYNVEDFQELDEQKKKILGELLWGAPKSLFTAATDRKSGFFWNTCWSAEKFQKEVLQKKGQDRLWAVAKRIAKISELYSNALVKVGFKVQDD